MNDEWKTLKLKTAVIEGVQKYIDEHPELGYRSVADFITDLIREKIYGE